MRDTHRHTDRHRHTGTSRHREIQRQYAYTQQCILAWKKHENNRSELIHLRQQIADYFHTNNNAFCRRTTNVNKQNTTQTQYRLFFRWYILLYLNRVFIRFCEPDKVIVHNTIQNIHFLLLVYGGLHSCICISSTSMHTLRALRFLFYTVFGVCVWTNNGWVFGDERNLCICAHCAS